MIVGFQMLVSACCLRKNNPVVSGLTNNSGLQINEDCSWDMLASSSLTEEGVEGIVTASNGLVRGHLAIRLDAMLKAV